MSSNICGAIVEPSCHNFEHKVTIVSITNARDVEKGRRATTKNTCPKAKYK